MPMGLITQNQCSLCTTAIAAGATAPHPKTLCRHMVDPEGRIMYQLTTMKKWSFEQAREAIDAYCEFLTLKISEEDYKPKMLSPTDVIDQVWHAHILDTEAYQSFNERFVVDGNTIHHNPLMSHDQETRKERCTNTIKAYEKYFGKPFPKDCKAWMYDDLSATLIVGNTSSPVGKVSVSDGMENTPKSVGTVMIRDQTGDEISIKANFKTTTFRKIAMAYSYKKGIHINQCRFILDGFRIGDFDVTLDSLELDDGDRVDVMLEELGC
jgi:hypothetical protein